MWLMNAPNISLKGGLFNREKIFRLVVHTKANRIITINIWSFLCALALPGYSLDILLASSSLRICSLGRAVSLITISKQQMIHIPTSHSIKEQDPLSEYRGNDGNTDKPPRFHFPQQWRPIDVKHLTMYESRWLSYAEMGS